MCKQNDSSHLLFSCHSAIGFSGFDIIKATLSLRRHGHDGIAFLLLHSCLSSCCLILRLDFRVCTCIVGMLYKKVTMIYSWPSSRFLIGIVKPFWFVFCLFVFLPVPDITHLMCYTFLGRRTSERFFFLCFSSFSDFLVFFLLFSSLHVFELRARLTSFYHLPLF